MTSARQFSLWTGIAVALSSALCFLPAFVFLLIPRVHTAAGFLAGLLLTLLVLAQEIGIILAVTNGIGYDFDFAVLVAVTAGLALVIVAAYTGLFLAAFAGHM